MTSDLFLGMTQAQRDRVALIDLRLRYMGEVGRQDLATRFGIQSAAASRDLAQYREIAPRNLDYDTKAKVYARAAWFRPVFDFPAERVLSWLCSFRFSTTCQAAKTCVDSLSAGHWTSKLDRSNREGRQP